MQAVLRACSEPGHRLRFHKTGTNFTSVRLDDETRLIYLDDEQVEQCMRQLEAMPALTFAVEQTSVRRLLTQSTLLNDRNGSWFIQTGAIDFTSVLTGFVTIYTDSELLEYLK